MHRVRHEQFWHGQGCPLFDDVHPVFSLPTMASPTFQGALKDGLGQAVVICRGIETVNKTLTSDLVN